MAVAGVRLLAFLFTLPLSGCQLFHRNAPEPPGPEYPPPIQEYIAAHRKVDRRPYEFIWANRQPNKDHLVDYESVMGWTVETSSGVVAELSRCQDVQLWDLYVGKLHVAQGAVDGHAYLRPPAPILIRDRLDTLECWVFPSVPSPDTQVALRLRTARGTERSLALGSLAAPGWSLLRQRVDAKQFEPEDYPLYLASIEITHLPPGNEWTLYLDGLSTYVERLHPIRFPPRPKLGVDLKAGLSAGAQTGEGVLPFPTTATTFLPPAAPLGIAGAFRETAPGKYAVDVATGEDERWTYGIQVQNGLQSITLSRGDESPVRVLEDLRWVGIPTSSGALLVQRIESGSLYLEYERGDAYRFSVAGRSLVLDVAVRSGAAQEMAWRGASSNKGTEAIPIPFLQVPDVPLAQIAALRSSTASGRVDFISTIWDPYRSNASTAGTGDDQSGGFVRYAPQSNGHRNPLHERLAWTVSSRLDDVLPTIPNPTSTYARVLAERLWTTPDEPFTYASLLEQQERWKAWGLDQILVGLPPAIWREDHESRSLRLRANPYRDGNEGLESLLDALRTRGWDAALNLYYNGISPLSRFWSADAVARDSEMNLLPAAPGEFALKPLAALNWVTENLATLSSFSSGAVYLDEWTAQPPWASTDYDFRMPGAATFRQSMVTHGDLLLEHARIMHVPVLAPAPYALLYAGLADGMIMEGASESLRPYLPLFALHAIHPRSLLFGAGTPPTENDRDSDLKVDRYLADQLAYGHAGRLVNIPGRPDLTARSYYHLLAVQQRIALLKPQRISYGDAENRYLSTSEAWVNGVWRDSRLYVQYADGPECWINGSETSWTIRVAAEEYVLPASGWLIQGGDLLAFSGDVEGRRVDFVQCDDYVYMDGRGQNHSVLGFSATGPVLFRRDEEGLTIQDLLQSGSVGLPADWIPSTETPRVMCMDPDGASLGDGGLERVSDGWLLTAPPGTAQYRIRMEGADSD